ncbi:SDR family oxidoreductase [Aliikangiella marina]|nr:SDR family oxidoreductase [Aliikangiella marina]
MSRPTVLITGGSKRIGKATAIAFASRGCNIALHYNHSRQSAERVQEEISHNFSVTCTIHQGELNNYQPATEKLISECLSQHGRLDYLINNASIFYPTPMREAKPAQLDSFLKVNCLAAKHLAELAWPSLQKAQGAIVNLIDIYADAGLAEHTLYTASKACLKSLTQELALVMAPWIRVNGVSPGAILWPEQQSHVGEEQLKILASTSLKKLGTAEAIAETVVFLAMRAHYITGSVINVDGGRRDFI